MVQTVVGAETVKQFTGITCPHGEEAMVPCCGYVGANEDSPIAKGFCLNGVCQKDECTRDISIYRDGSSVRVVIA